MQQIKNIFIFPVLLIFIRITHCRDIAVLGLNTKDDQVAVRGFDEALPNEMFLKLKAELLILNGKSDILQDGTAFFPLFNSKTQKSVTEPRNFIELSIQYLFQMYTSSEEKTRIIGGEWWTQTKKKNQGLVFHYDKDEGYYQKYQKVKSPLISTITYLNDIGCPTLILNQTRNQELFIDEPLIPHEAYISYPKSNRHINFDGKLNHGVATSLQLKANGSETEIEQWSTWIYGLIFGTDKVEQRRSFLINWWDKIPDAQKCKTIPDQKWKEIGLFYPEIVKEFTKKMKISWTKETLLKGGVDPSIRNPIDIVPLGIGIPGVSLENKYEQKVEMMSRGDGFYFDMPPLQSLLNRTLYKVTWGENNVFGTVSVLDLSSPVIFNTMMSTIQPKFIIFCNENDLDEFIRIALPIAKNENILGKGRFYVATPKRSGAAMRFFGIETYDTLPMLVVDDMASRQIKKILWKSGKNNAVDIRSSMLHVVLKYLQESDKKHKSEL